MKQLGIILGAVVTLGLLAFVYLVPMQGAFEERADPRARQTPAGDPIAAPDSAANDTDQSPAARLNDRIAQTALSHPLVKGAWAVAMEQKGVNTALVGIEVTQSQIREEWKEIERAVQERVAAVPGIERAVVTTDPVILSQIRQMNRGIAQGDSASKHRAEFEDLQKYLFPRDEP